VVNNKPTESRGLGSGDLLPVATNYDQAAATVLSASDTGFTRTWDTSAKDPSGYPGWFRQVGTELAGQTFMWTLNDMPDLAAYGLISAALCNPSGATCVQPSTADVNAALNSATKDSAGLLQVNPAKVPSGAYPLVDVVYAAVSVKQSASALSDYADFIAYAAKKGQVTGSAPGDLPPGYLPLTSSLQAQAQSVVKQLRALAGPASTPIPTVTHSATPTRSASPTVSATQGGGTQGPTAPVTQPGATPTGAGPGGSTLPGTGGSTPGGTGGGPTGATSGSTCTATAAATGTATASASPSSTVTPVSTVSPAGAGACTSSSSSPSAQGPVVVGPSAELVSGTTPRNDVGGIRDALIIVLIIGAAGALGGTLLRFGRLPRRTREWTDGT
jgi:hypothetical protein